MEIDMVVDWLNRTELRTRRECSWEKEVLNKVGLALVVFNIVVGLAGNALCLLAFRHQLVVKKDKPYIHQMSIVIADTLSLLSAIPLIFTHLSHLFCGAVPYRSTNYWLALFFLNAAALSVSLSTASSLLLILASIDRIQAMTQLMKYKLIDQKKRAKLASLISYAASLALCMYPIGNDVVLWEGNGEYRAWGRLSGSEWKVVMDWGFVSIKLGILAVLIGSQTSMVVIFIRSEKKRKTQTHVLGISVGMPGPQIVRRKVLLIITTVQGTLVGISTAFMCLSHICWLVSVSDVCMIYDTTTYVFSSLAVTYNFIFFLCLSKDFRGIVLNLFKK